MKNNLTFEEAMRLLDDAVSKLESGLLTLDESLATFEEAVKLINKPVKIEEDDGEEEPVYVDYFREMELRIQSHLGRRVMIKGKGRKKSLTLFYEDNEDLDELLKTICGENFLEEFN